MNLHCTKGPANFDVDKQGCTKTEMEARIVAGDMGLVRIDHESRMHLIDYANTPIRAMMDEARQAIWDLRHGEGAPADLVTCISEMAQRLSREYSVSLTSSSFGEPFPFNHQQTYELLMVAREVFFNAILHGRPEKIGAEVRFTPRTLELVIADDGRGFDPAAPSPGRWAARWALRAARIKGACRETRTNCHH